MRKSHLLLFLPLVAAVARPSARAQRPPLPVRPLGPVLRATRDTLRSVASIRVLSDGRVLVNDATARRVVLFDSSLATFVSVADTSSETHKAYGTSGSLDRFLGDSSLWIDPRSSSMLVIDPAGTIGRVMAIPGRTDPVSDIGYLLYLARAESDGAGHLLLSEPHPIVWPPRPSGQASDEQEAWADSAPLIRVDVVARKLDTVARLKTATQTVRYWAGNSVTQAPVWMPVSAADSWALLEDGTIAVVRVSDYHIDWIAPGGARTSSPKIAHEWTRLTDGMKVALIDSMKVRDSVTLAGTAATRDSIQRATGRASAGPTGAAAHPRKYIDPGDIPDYWPPFGAVNGTGALPIPVLVDADGNLWIKTLPQTPLEGGLVYDVVNRAGALTDRVQIPGGTTIVGFGPGVAYLTSRAGTGTQLARMRIR